VLDVFYDQNKRNGRKHLKPVVKAQKKKKITSLFGMMSVDHIVSFPLLATQV